MPDALQVGIKATINRPDLENQLRSIERDTVIRMKISGGEPLGRLTGKVGEFDKSIAAANARVIAFGASAAVIGVIGVAIRAMVVESIKVEKSLADINVILNQSSANLAKFGNSLFNIAKNTGQSFAEVAKAATELSRQGLTAQEVLQRTNDALILTRLSGLDATKSLEALTAAVNSFAREGLTTTDVINKLAAVDAKFAVNTGDLAEAVKRAGSSVEDAGNSFEEFIALVATAQEKTARGGAVIGNAFKSIFNREGRSKTLDDLDKLGIAVRDTEGNTLPAIKILQNLAQSYDSLGPAAKSFATNLVGGTYQANILKAVMGDLAKTNSRYSQALDTANNSSDEAIKRNAKLSETLASTANAAQVNFAKIAAAGGKLTLGPALSRVLGGFNNLTDKIGSGKEGTESFGEKAGVGFLKGIGRALSGPGLVIAAALGGKFFLKFAEFGAKALVGQLGIGKASESIQASQGAINQLLQTDKGLREQIFSSTISQLEKEELLLKAIQLRIDATSLLARETELLAQVTQVAGFRVNEGGQFTSGRVKSKAGGHIPTSSIPPQAIAQEVLGAKMNGYTISPSDVRAMRANIGGSQSTVVYNNKERVINNFGGSGEPAIIPPNRSITDMLFGAGGINIGGFRVGPKDFPLAGKTQFAQHLQAAGEFGSKYLGIKASQFPSVSFANRSELGALGGYGEGKARIYNVDIADYLKKQGRNSPNTTDYYYGDTAAHEIGHSFFETKKEALVSKMQKLGSGIVIPKTKKDALNFIAKHESAGFTTKADARIKNTYSDYAFEEAIVRQFPQFLRTGFINRPGGQMPRVKIPSLINYEQGGKLLGDVELKRKGGALKLDMVRTFQDAQGNRLKGTGILDFAFKKLFNHASAAGINEVGFTPINGRVISKARRLFGETDSAGRPIDFGSNVRLKTSQFAHLFAAGGGIPKHRITLPAPFYDAIKKHAAAKPTTVGGKIKHAMALAANKVLVDGPRLLHKAEPFIDFADDAFNLAGKVFGFSGGYLHASPGYLGDKSRAELLAYAKEKGIADPRIDSKTSTVNLRKYISQSQPYRREAAKLARPQYLENIGLSRANLEAEQQTRLRIATGIGTGLGAKGQKLFANAPVQPQGTAQAAAAAQAAATAQTAAAQANSIAAARALTQQQNAARVAQINAQVRQDILNQVQRPRASITSRLASATGSGAGLYSAPILPKPPIPLPTGLNYGPFNAYPAPSVPFGAPAGSYGIPGGLIGPPTAAGAHSVESERLASGKAAYDATRASRVRSALTSGFKGGANGAAFANKALLASFVAPVLGSTLGEFASTERGKERIGGVTNSIGTGLSVAALGGGSPISIAIGSLVAAFGSLKAEIVSLSPSIKELHDNFLKADNKATTKNQNLEKFASSREQLQDGVARGATGAVLERLKRNEREQRSKLSGVDLRKLSSGVPVEAIYEERQRKIAQDRAKQAAVEAITGANQKSTISTRTERASNGASNSLVENILNPLTQTGQFLLNSAGVNATNIEKVPLLGKGLAKSYKENNGLKRFSASERDDISDQLLDTVDISKFDYNRIAKIRGQGAPLSVQKSKDRGDVSALVKEFGFDKKTEKALNEASPNNVFDVILTFLNKLEEKSGAYKVAATAQEEYLSGFSKFSKAFSDSLDSITEKTSLARIIRGGVNDRKQQANEAQASFYSPFAGPDSQPLLAAKQNIDRIKIAGADKENDIQDKARELLRVAGTKDVGDNEESNKFFRKYATDAINSNNPLRGGLSFQKKAESYLSTHNPNSGFLEQIKTLGDSLKALNLESKKNSLQTGTDVQNELAGAGEKRSAAGFSGVLKRLNVAGNVREPLDLSEISAGQSAQIQLDLDRHNPAIQARNRQLLSNGSVLDRRRAQLAIHDAEIPGRDAITKGIESQFDQGLIPTGTQIAYAENARGQDGNKLFSEQQVQSFRDQNTEGINSLAAGYSDKGRQVLNKTASAGLNGLVSRLPDLINSGSGLSEKSDIVQRLKFNAQTGNFNAVQKDLKEIRPNLNQVGVNQFDAYSKQVGNLASKRTLLDGASLLTATARGEGPLDAAVFNTGIQKLIAAMTGTVAGPSKGSAIEANGRSAGAYGQENKHNLQNSQNADFDEQRRALDEQFKTYKADVESKAQEKAQSINGNISITIDGKNIQLDGTLTDKLSDAIMNSAAMKAVQESLMSLRADITEAKTGQAQPPTNYSAYA